MGMRPASFVGAWLLVAAAAIGCGGSKQGSPTDAADANGFDAPVEPDAGADVPAGSDASDAPPVVVIPLEHVTSVFPARGRRQRLHGRAAAPVLRHAADHRGGGQDSGVRRGQRDAGR
jgi:hypothetical protein